MIILRKIQFVILLTGFISTLCLNSIPASGQPETSSVIDQIVAVVGNDPILLSDIENQYYQSKAQGISSDGDMKCEILEDLLFQKLLLNQARVDSLEVTDAQIEQTLNGRLKMFISQIGSEEKLEEYFKKPMAQIKTDLRTLLRDQLLTQKMQAKIMDEIKITPSEVRAYFRGIPKDSIPLIETQYQVTQIVKYPKISDAAKSEIKEKLMNFKDRVQKGEKFSTLAVLYSEDPGSSRNSGDLGFVSRGDLVPEFAAVAFNLNDKDEISKVVETEYGFHIIQLIERRGERINIRHILMSPKVTIEEKIRLRSQLDSIAIQIREQKISFADAAQRFSEDADTKNNGGKMVNPQTGSSRFEGDEIESQTFNMLKKLEISEVSAPFEYRDDKGRIAYKLVSLLSKSSPHMANLQEDYQLIHDMALNRKKMTEQDQWIIKQQKSTYISIDPSFGNCNFRNKGWYATSIQKE
jgi:peptidyl-prolyl cis-trans isomerase SurA